MGKAVSTASTLIITRLVAQYLGVSGYGDFAIILTYAAYFYIVTDFGINAIVVKDVAPTNRNYRSSKRNASRTSNSKLLDSSSPAKALKGPLEEYNLPSYIKNLTALRTVMAGVLIGLGLIVLAFLPYPPEVKTGVAIGLLTVLSQAHIFTTDAFFQSFLKYNYATIARTIGSAFNLLAAFTIIKLDGGLLPIVASFAISGFLVNAVAFGFLRRFGPLGLSFDPILWKTLFRRAFPLGIAQVLNIVYFKADMFLLSILALSPSLNLTNSEAVGFYSLPYKVFEVALVFAGFFSNAVYPVMIKRAEEGTTALKRVVKKALWSIFIAAMGAMVLYLVLAPWIIKIISGSESFAPSVLVLRILALGLPFFYLSSVLFWVTITLGKQKTLAYTYGFTAIINIVLNLIFIPQHGYLAAAIITNITEFLVLLILVCINRKFLFKTSARI